MPEASISSRSDPASAAVTPDLAAVLHARAATDAGKWAFMDAVFELVTSAPANTSQSAVVDAIASTQAFIDLCGDHRDPANGGAARSRAKSIKDELAVVKMWPVGMRVSGVSFEAHKLVNRLGAPDGSELLCALVAEAGGAANVSKDLVKEKLDALYPRHKARPNGKKKRALEASEVSAGSLVDQATILVRDLTVARLRTDPRLANVVSQIVDVYAEFTNQNEHGDILAEAGRRQRGRDITRVGAALRSAVDELMLLVDDFSEGNNPTDRPVNAGESAQWPDEDIDPAAYLLAPEIGVCAGCLAVLARLGRGRSGICERGEPGVSMGCGNCGFELCGEVRRGARRAWSRCGTARPIRTRCVRLRVRVFGPGSNRVVASTRRCGPRLRCAT